MPADKVRIHHPETGNVSAVSRSAFERRSRKLGWVLADEAPGDAHINREFPQLDNPGHGGDRAALVAEASALGLKVHHRAKPETIRRQIEKAKADL
jgi:hypothetical protein